MSKILLEIQFILFPASLLFALSSSSLAHNHRLRPTFQVPIKPLKSHLDILPKQPGMQEERREPGEGFQLLERRAAECYLALLEYEGVQRRDPFDRRATPLECCRGVFLGEWVRDS
jgi:hypothetical protein